MVAEINLKTWILMILLLLTTTIGCDDRATQIAREAADRQAQQNTEMAELNKEVATGAHQLVEADAKGRTEIVGIHHDLQAERARLDANWKDLEDERRRIAGQRRTESMLVSVCELVGGLSLVAALLGFCWYALFAARRGDGTDAQLNELLIQEILIEGEPMLSASQTPKSLIGHLRAEKPSDE